MRKVLLFVLVGALTLGIGGCMTRNPVYVDVDSIQEIQDKLGDFYHFEVTLENELYGAYMYAVLTTYIPSIVKSEYEYYGYRITLYYFEEGYLSIEAES